MDKRALTTGEIADWCSVNFRTVLRWIERGDLKAFKLPGDRGDNRVRVEDFLGFLTTHGMPIPQELQTTAKRLLLVEDNPADVRLFMAAIDGHGFDVKQTGNGFQAGALLGTFLPGVLVLDLNIPGLGGLDVIRMVRTMDQLKNMRILVVSAMDQAKLDGALACGADDALQKPYDYRTLVEKISGLAEGTGRRRHGR